MTLARLWAFLAVGLPVLASLIGNLSAVDLAYHLRAGEMTLDTGRIPMTDTFTFTAAGASWMNQQWGAQVILAAAFRVAGWTGLVLLRAGLIGLTFGLLFEACRRRGIDLRRAAWLTLGAFIVSAAAALVNPLGPGVWAYAAGLTTNAFVTNRITEWQPTTLRTIPGILFFGSAALVTVLLARRGRATVHGKRTR